METIGWITEHADTVASIFVAAVAVLGAMLQRASLRGQVLAVVRATHTVCEAIEAVAARGGTAQDVKAAVSKVHNLAEVADPPQAMVISETVAAVDPSPNNVGRAAGKGRGKKLIQLALALAKAAKNAGLIALALALCVGALACVRGVDGRIDWSASVDQFLDEATSPEAMAAYSEFADAWAEFEQQRNAPSEEWERKKQCVRDSFLAGGMKYFGYRLECYGNTGQWPPVDQSLAAATAEAMNYAEQHYQMNLAVVAPDVLLGRKPDKPDDLSILMGLLRGYVDRNVQPEGGTS